MGYLRGMTTTDILVDGMTCGHCVASVTEELTALDGVQSVSVDLVKGASSRVTIESALALDDAQVRAAVEDAGYTLSAGS